MKKFLSLVLALIMTMSLVTIGAGATEYRDLTDKDEIQYEEAVAVLNRIGVITGYDDGSFQPTRELTRGAAAKIIVSLLIGPEAASNLPNATAPYPDVPASHTFAGVISYCKTAGIISGYSDGSFQPGGTLTGYTMCDGEAHGRHMGWGNKRLELRDISLANSMISLGSCTMKLNAAALMQPLSLAGFQEMHPFAPADQCEGYRALIEELEQDLATITGFAACSLQPNSGAAGEYSGLMVIRAYHQSRGQGYRNIVLIPASAHGTNPASAAMAGMKIVTAACDANDNIPTITTAFTFASFFIKSPISNTHAVSLSAYAYATSTKLSPQSAEFAPGSPRTHSQLLPAYAAVHPQFQTSTE